MKKKILSREKGVRASFAREQGVKACRSIQDKVAETNRNLLPVLVFSGSGGHGRHCGHALDAVHCAAAVTDKDGCRRARALPACRADLLEEQI